MTVLFSPSQVGALTVPNRFVRSADRCWPQGPGEGITCRRFT